MKRKKTLIGLVIFKLALGAATLALADETAVYEFMFPDPKLTPGATFSWITKKDVCTSGYTKKVRKVPFTKKMEVFRRYGIRFIPHTYEIDHFIPLELGGSNDITNLWPEAYTGAHGAREKDAVENYLHDEVCKEHITLKQAQAAIRSNWFKIYKDIQSERN